MVIALGIILFLLFFISPALVGLFTAQSGNDDSNGFHQGNISDNTGE